MGGEDEGPESVEKDSVMCFPMRISIVLSQIFAARAGQNYNRTGSECTADRTNGAITLRHIAAIIVAQCAGAFIGTENSTGSALSMVQQQNGSDTPVDS